MEVQTWSKRRLADRHQAATFLGISPATVTNWIAEGMPALSHGRAGARMVIDLEAAVKWIVSRHPMESASDQRRRLLSAQAQKIEVDNARRRGQLVLARPGASDPDRTRHAGPLGTVGASFGVRRGRVCNRWSTG